MKKKEIKERIEYLEEEQKEGYSQYREAHIKKFKIQLQKKKDLLEIPPNEN